MQTLLYIQMEIFIGLMPAAKASAATEQYK